MKNRRIRHKLLTRGYLFIASFKDENIVETMELDFMKQCYEENIIIQDFAIDRSFDVTNIDRQAIRELVGKLYDGDYGVLVIRNLNDICEYEEDQKAFMKMMDEMQIEVFSLDLKRHILAKYDFD